MKSEDMKIHIIKGLEEAEHFHMEMEVLFVIEGTAKVQLQGQEHLMNREDILLVNSGALHTVEGANDSVICRIHYACRKLLDLSGKDVCMFQCDSVRNRTRPYRAIRTILREVVYTYVKKTPEQNDCMLISVLYKLLDCLFQDFMIEDQNMVDGYRMDDSLKIQKIYQYVNQNYQYGISMSELADQLYLSTSTLSRFFKKQTGIYFADYVSHIRMTHAVEELIHTDKSITLIAVDCGFSNPSAFNRSFKEIYGMTPSDYRIAKQKERLEAEELLRVEEEKLRQELAANLDEQTLNIAGKIRVVADVTEGRPFVKRWTEIMNLGSIDLLGRAAFQQQVLFLKKELDFQYGRIWSIFSQKTMLCTGKEGSDYNFGLIDSSLKFLIDHDMIPFLDFANRVDLAMGELNKSVFKRFDYIPFESKAAWEDCMVNFLEHVIDRFGVEEVNRWKFEFSYDLINAPDTNYYVDKNYSFRETFASGYRIIRRYLPDAEIGGPMGIVDLEENFIRDFLISCKMNQCMPDFVSFLLFPYTTYRQGNKIISDPATTDVIEEEHVRYMQQLLLDTGCSECKLYITEWNNSVSNRNYLNDSCFRGTYFMKKISSLSEMVDKIGVWMASDMISNYVDSNSIANGGGGIITREEIPKPVFYALSFLKHLGNKLICKGEGYLVTQTQTGSFYIICYNFKWYSSSYFSKRELLSDPEDIETIFENQDPIEISLTLKNLPEKKRYIVTQRCVAESFGSLLGEWRKFQYDTQLTEENIQYIKNASFPRMSMERKEVTNGCLCMNVKLSAHDFVMLHVHEDKRRIRS